MRYLNTKPGNHESSSKIGVLLVNLGTPDAPTAGALRRYLKPFLSDPRVVEPTMPRWIWWLILNGVILNVRPGRSAKAYQTVWDHYGEGTGSPLLHISQQQKQALESSLDSDRFVCALAMSYGNPSIQKAMLELKAQNISQLLVLPLYPQYSATTTGAVFDAVTRELQTWRKLPELRFVNQYHDEPLYIDALKHSVLKHWEQHGQADQLIMSFHGIPERYLNNGDPYFCHCHKTGRLLAEALGLSKEQYQVTFQSIFGREPWLQPYTSETLKSLPAQGVKNVQVICPGFAADCLETIEEISVENREYFEAAGGEAYSYIPALNDDSSHIKVLNSVIEKHSVNWQTVKPNSQAYQMLKGQK